MPVIQFTNIPSNLRNTGVFAEVDASQANTATQQQVTLLMGQMLDSGVAAPNEPIIATNLVTTKQAFGIGSMLANMYVQYMKTDPFATIYLVGIPDAESGNAATGTITFGSSPSAQDVSANGTLSLYLAGTVVPVLVQAGDTNATVAGNVAAAIAVLTDLPVSASVSTNVVTLTANNAGVAAGDCDIRLNYLGALNSESTPSGLNVTINPMSGGTEDPDISTALANLAAQGFDFICTPYTGSANLNAGESFIGDSGGGRWGFESALYGHFFTAYRGNFAAQVSFGVSRNDQHCSVLGFYDSPTPAYLVAADSCAANASTLRIDPALPVGGAGDGVTMNWLAPPIASQFDFAERESLLFDGISTYVVEQGGRVRVEYTITTYQLNGAGQPDNSYLNVETMYTLMFFIRGIKTDLTSKFARKKLVSNNTRIGFGSNFVTPQMVENEAIAFYNLMAAQGIVQNPAVFAQNVAANAPGGGTVQLYLPIDLAGQLRRIEMLVQFQTTT